MAQHLGVAVALCCAVGAWANVPTLQADGNKNTWAVIAVGSSSFMNYRHQADGCHAYQLLRKKGIPAEQIIMMMQDDVASSSENPFKGKLFNKPGTNPPDVYEGCKVDYRGSIVTAKLFLSVITGDESGVPANGKLLKSTSSDRVFLNFVDHGGTGIIAFPNGPTLHSSELATALKTMQSKKMYSELLFYMEACESGSMFPGLATDSKIFAVTASNAKESSWGFYCDDDKVNGTKIGSCLGDLFSIAWMEDSDLGKAGETIKTQVARVTKRVNKSHVTTFGDKSFEKEPFSNFELQSNDDSMIPDMPAKEGEAWDVRDIPLQFAYRQWEAAKDGWPKKAAFAKLERVIKGRSEDEHVFHKVAASVCKGMPYGCSYSLLKERQDLVDLDCHYDLVNIVHEVCPKRAQHNPGGWNAFNMKFSQMLANICEKRSLFNRHMDSLKQIMHAECSESAVSWQAMAASDTEKGDEIVV